MLVNLDEVKIKLDKLSDIDLKGFLTDAGMTVEREAKINAPSRSGELRNSIASRVNGNEAIIGTNLQYAIYVHQGTGLFAVNGDGRTDVPWVYCDAEGNFHSTSGQAPQPFLTNALESCKPQIKELLKQYTKEAIK